LPTVLFLSSSFSENHVVSIPLLSFAACMAHVNSWRHCNASISLISSFSFRFVSAFTVNVSLLACFSLFLSPPWSYVDGHSAEAVCVGQTGRTLECVLPVTGRACSRSSSLSRSTSLYFVYVCLRHTRRIGMRGLFTTVWNGYQAMHVNKSSQTHKDDGRFRSDCVTSMNCEPSFEPS